MTKEILRSSDDVLQSETHYRRNPMRRLAAFTVMTVTLLAIAVAVSAWTVQDCVEVNYDHPDCDQYPTTTTLNDPCDEYHETRHPECQTTTTQPEVTTTTSDNTTTTQPEVVITVPQTTTTIQECVPPLVHQPPFCVDPTTTAPPVETVPAPTTPAGEDVLPFTGSSTGMLALSALGLLLIGGAMVRKAQA